MTQKPQIGKNIFNEAINRGRHASNAARRALNTLIEDQPGPQSRALLIAKLAWSVAELEAVISELDEIGRNAKNGTTRKRTKRTLKNE